MLRAVLLVSCLVNAPAGQEPRAGKDSTGNAPAPASASPTIGDRVVLRDGQVVLGLVTSSAAGPRVGFDMLVRRDWAEAHVPEHAARWARNAATMSKPALAERRRRLEAWRGERSRAAGGEDRIVAWIDAELKRMDDPESRDAPLFSVRIPRDGCRSAERGSDSGRRMLALGWLCSLPDVEDRPIAEVRDALESRGFAVEGGEIPPLDRLLPIVEEPESKWLARRAATELAVEPGRRFIRYNNLLMPDQGDGRPADAGIDPSMLLGEIGKLLDPNAGAVDPLAPALERIAAQGGSGAVVTRLELAPDLSRVMVEVALWVRGPRGWDNYGSRNVIVRPEDVEPAAGADLARDPQIQSVFNIAESLGLGAVTGEMKDRSLRIGAATSRALALARSSFTQEMNSLAFPVLETVPKP
ncbi:hypothetical protein [Planctomyces sp. SH-PL62]|uniref:hypothetical protein n=1 Tax=Planctomyces sp. SH-PL62 TaxID=1636152 RepID=UPI00078E73BB|nr:hypothetical protein [Planctomyces sp. SH-PL62]AMV40100.1 hypothetical protein VT85_21890 [Planctomyces sp. SH-PL62]